MTVIVAITVMILLMCRLRRGWSNQRFVVQQTPLAYGRADVIRIRLADYVECSNVRCMVPNLKLLVLSLFTLTFN